MKKVDKVGPTLIKLSGSAHVLIVKPMKHSSYAFAAHLIVQLGITQIIVFFFFFKKSQSCMLMLQLEETEDEYHFLFICPVY